MLYFTQNGSIPNPLSPNMQALKGVCIFNCLTFINLLLALIFMLFWVALYYYRACIFLFSLN